MGWKFYDSSGNQAISQLGTLAITAGGTGATSASAARTGLGLAIGSNVQAYDADLDAIEALSKTANNFMMANGSVWALTTPANARTGLGVGTGNSPQFTGIELGHATANTLTASGGVLSIESNRIFHAGGADVPVADGGTNLSSYAVGDVLYASGTTTLAKLAKPGTPAGEVLTFATGNSAPTWVAAAAGVGLGLVIALGG